MGLTIYKSIERWYLIENVDQESCTELNVSRTEKSLKNAALNHLAVRETVPKFYKVQKVPEPNATKNVLN